MPSFLIRSVAADSMRNSASMNVVSWTPSQRVWDKSPKYRRSYRNGIYSLLIVRNMEPRLRDSRTLKQGAMVMANGYMGKILRVHLSEGKIAEEALRQDWARKFIGGAGLVLMDGNVNAAKDQHKEGVCRSCDAMETVLERHIAVLIPLSSPNRYLWPDPLAKPSFHSP